MRGSVVKKPNGRWYVVTRHATGDGRYRQQWHGGHRTRRAAEAALVEIVSKLNKGTFVEPSRLTVAEYVEAWLERKANELRPSTLSGYRHLVRLHLLPHIGTQRLQTLTAALLNNLYAALLSDGRVNGSGGLSPKTVRHVHTVIHRCLADAVDDDLVVQNVAAKAKPPRGKRGAKEMKTWSAQELRSFLEAVAEDRLFALWRVLATTGLRRGEVLGLRWEDVDLDAGRISIRRTLVNVDYSIVESDAKTANGVRVVDLDDVTVASLRRHRRRQQEERLAASHDFKYRPNVFVREDGEWIHPDRLTQMFDAHVKAAGLPRIRLHDLRHTHATLALRAGVPVKIISERLGHAHVAFTMQTYAHAVPGMQAEAAAQVAALLD